MIDIFDRLYTSIKDNSKFLKNIRYYFALRSIICIGINIFAPIYFNLTKGNKLYSLIPSHKNEGRIIVSLTTFPPRINRIWLAIETILRQATKPDKIILWLSKEQFPSMELLPSKLLRQIDRGLEIRLKEDDIRSHKKYYYAIKEFPKDFIITIDDDVFYNSQLLSQLIELNQKYPLAVCCNHAIRIIVKNENIAPYLSWQTVEFEQYPNCEIMAIGVGGILYPPYSLYYDTFNIAIIKKYCFLADDIWLNIMAHLNETKVAKTAYNSNYLRIINSKNITLNSKNVNEGLNDKQLKSTREYYLKNHGIDPYKDIIRN